MSFPSISGTKVTVGIPTFNRARWLRETMDSVLSQSFTNFRLIVSDNASEDDTPDVVRSFNDDRIDYVRSELNIGAIENFNRLIELTDTDYFVLLPDDDVLYPGYLAAAVQVLDQFQTVGLAHSAFDFIDASSRAVRRVHPLVSHSTVKLDRRDLALERLMVSPVGICFSSVAYRTKAIVEAGGFRREEEPCCDLQLWMRIAVDWDFGYMADPLVGFRTHSESLTANIAAQHGVTSEGPDRILLHSQISFQRRIDFLEDAPLESRTTKRLRALATLRHLVESAGLGLPWNEAMSRLTNLVWAYPRIVLRPQLWRFAVAQLGGRRIRSALRAAQNGTALRKAKAIRPGSRF